MQIITGRRIYNVTTEYDPAAERYTLSTLPDGSVPPQGEWLPETLYGVAADFDDALDLLVTYIKGSEQEEVEAEMEAE